MLSPNDAEHFKIWFFSFITISFSRIVLNFITNLHFRTITYHLVPLGVGKKVRIRELMDIASPEAGDNHVIHVKDYDDLQKAIKRATYLKIGMS